MIVKVEVGSLKGTCVKKLSLGERELALSGV